MNADVQNILNDLIGRAEFFLNKYGELFPIGASVDSEGKFAVEAWSDGTEQPTSAAVKDGLRSVFAKKANESSMRACGLCWDARIRLDEAAEPMDALCLEAESSDGEAYTAYVPYTKIEGGTVELGKFEGFIADPQYFTDHLWDSNGG